MAIERQLLVDANGQIQLPKSMHTDMAHLDGSGSVRQTEESLRALGQYLGLDSSRPDNEYGTGPDVFWRISKLPALCIECKTDKERGSEYRKHDIGQLSDHVQWIKNNSDAKVVIPVFVGPIVKATERSNPPPEFRVIELQEFKNLSKILRSALADVCTSAIPINLRQILFETLKARNLLWPRLFEELKSNQLKNPDE